MWVSEWVYSSLALLLLLHMQPKLSQHITTHELHFNFFFAFTSSKLSRPSYHFSHLIHAVWLWYYPDAVFPHSNSISYSSSSSLRTFFLLVLSFFRRFRFVSILFTRHSTFLLFPLFSCLLAGLLDFLYLVWFGLVWLETLFAHTVFFSSVCEIISDTEWMWVFMYIYIKRVQEIRVLFYLSPRYTMYIFVGAVGFFSLFLSLLHIASRFILFDRKIHENEWAKDQKFGKDKHTKTHTASTNTLRESEIES